MQLGDIEGYENWLPADSGEGMIVPAGTSAASRRIDPAGAPAILHVEGAFRAPGSPMMRVIVLVFTGIGTKIERS